MATIKMTKIAVEREYDVADVPDLQDTKSKRRMMIRPRKATVHQIHDTNLVHGVTVEGQQVRVDGELSGSRLIGVGYSRWYTAAPPNWVNTILADDELEWATDDDLKRLRKEAR